MSKMSSFGTALSGLNAAQTGLYVTGHNMSNVDTKGFTRQRIVQDEFIYVGLAGNLSPNKMQLGLGTDIRGIQQVRDKFLDIGYRKEAGKGAFYEAKAEAGTEIETIFGELQSDYKTQTVITDLWESLNELSTFQPGLDTRGNFVSTCITFVNKANNAFDRMVEYQHNIDIQIRETTDQINVLVEKVEMLNREIKIAEYSGDRANDYRDQMNDAVDELSKLAAVEIKNEKDGGISILLEGKELLANGSISKLGLRYTSSDFKLVEPVFTNSTDILPFNAPNGTYQTVFTLTGEHNSQLGNDYGKLKGLMISKGYTAGSYLSPLKPDVNLKDTNGNFIYQPEGEEHPLYKLQMQKNKFDTEYAIIPRAQKEFDTIVNKIVTLVNDTLAPYVKDPSSPDFGKKDPNAPYGLSGAKSYQEIFTRKHVPRFSEDGTYNAEDSGDRMSLYTIGNIEINKNLLSAGGYNDIALSESGDIEDTKKVLDMLSNWHDAFISIDGGNPLSVDDAYRKFIVGVASGTSESINYAEEQTILTDQLNNKRLSMSGVTLDDEMANMMKYQHAYNASARLVNTVNEMMETVTNMVGR